MGARKESEAIFIDGLDQCADGDAQVKIIEIIASSIREGSTLFYWAIFSCTKPRCHMTENTQLNNIIFFLFYIIINFLLLNSCCLLL